MTNKNSVSPVDLIRLVRPPGMVAASTLPSFPRMQRRSSSASLAGQTGAVETRIRLPEYTDYVWHGLSAEVRPGQLYGYRVYGPYAPQRRACVLTTTNYCLTPTPKRFPAN